jgi:hypothetical protein
MADYSSKRQIRILLLLAGTLALNANAPAHGQDEVNIFGRPEESQNALIGIMYDLKQTPDRKPTNENSETYFNVINEFLQKGWDEGVLNRYYRVSRPLYTTQIFVPMMNADDGPKAFGAEKTVRPSLWVIHYKGEVSAPSAGTYRFWGSADDLLATAVDGKTELVYYITLPNLPAWKPSESDGAQAADGRLRPGDWFTVGPDQIIDLDVIIGERPGGYFNAFLMVEKKGETYKKDGDGHPILPIFQVAPYDTPALNNVGMEPTFAVRDSFWKCFQ